MMAKICFVRNFLVCAFVISISTVHGADMQLAYANSSTSPYVFLIDGTRVFRDVTYGTNDGVALKMDIRVPFSANSNSAPAVIRIHGGSWSVGDKASPGCVTATVQQL